MVNEKYLFVAENLAERNKNRLNTNRSPKEQETEELFYWIISRLEWSIRGCYPARESHSVTVKISHWYNDGSVLLEHGRVSDYLSEYVRGEEFYTVMNDVANIFNEIGKSDENGYHFYATCILPEYTTETAELTVHMFTKNKEIQDA